MFLDSEPDLDGDLRHSLTQWYAAQVADPSGHDAATDLLTSGLDLLNESPRRRMRQSDVCERSGRSATVVHRYFHSVTDFETILRVLHLEISLFEDLAMLRRLFRDQGRTSIFREPTEIVDRGADPIRLKRRLDRASNLALLAMSTRGIGYLEGMLRRICFHVSREFRYLQATQDLFLGRDAHVSTVWVNAVSFSRIISDLDATFHHGAIHETSEFWWSLNQGVALRSVNGATASNQHISPLPWMGNVDRSVAYAHPEMADRSRNRLGSLVVELSELVQTGQIGLNEVDMVKNLSVTRPTVGSYLGEGRSIFGSAGLYWSLERVLDLQAALEQVSKEPTDVALSHFLAWLTRSTAHGILVALSDPKSELEQPVWEALQRAIAEVGDRLIDLKICQDEKNAVTASTLAAGWSYMSFVRQITDEEIPLSMWQDACAAAWMNSLNRP